MSTQQTNKQPSILNRILIGMFLVLLMTTVEGMVLSFMWNWFVAPITHLERINVFQACGIVIVASYLFGDKLFRIPMTFEDGVDIDMTDVAAIVVIGTFERVILYGFLSVFVFALNMI